ncbi:MAG: DUF4271 domain-containing protein [Bacteroidales bacterium]
MKPDSIVISAADSLARQQAIAKLLSEQRAAGDSAATASDSMLMLSDSFPTVPPSQVVSTQVEQQVWPISQFAYFAEQKHTLPGSQFMLYVGVFLLATLALLRYVHRKRIKQAFKAGFKTAYASRLFRETSSQRSRGGAFLHLIFIGSISMLLYYTLPNTFFSELPILRFFSICIASAAYFYIKSTIYHLVGLLSDMQEVADEYVFHGQIYNHILGLALLPVVIVLSFPLVEQVAAVKIIGFFLVFLAIIALIIRTSKILMGTGVSILYLILYLCTLEILPILYIYKFLAS